MARMLHRAGALMAMMDLRRYAPGPSTVSILTYHHVADDAPAYPYDPGVADATPAQFRRQMETLARHVTPIGIDELIRAVEGAPLPKNPVLPCDRFDIRRVSTDRTMSDAMFLTQVAVPRLAYIGRHDE